MNELPTPIAVVSASSRFKFRGPRVSDGAAIHRLISRCPPLDLNSLYAYLLLCRHHPDTCVVAEDGEGLAGFVSAYRLPQAPAPTLFIWQVAVAKRARGCNLALAMLLQLLERPATGGCIWLETTVTPSNAASRQVFVKLARHLGAGIAESTYFDKEDFQDQHHEPEMLIRIGPCLA